MSGRAADTARVARRCLTLRSPLSRWRNILPTVCSGAGPEVLHNFRVTGRRLGGLLRVLEAVPVPAAQRLRRGVRALVRSGNVARDLDVQRCVLEVAFGPTATTFFPSLGRSLVWRRLAAYTCLVRELRSQRTKALLGELERLSAECQVIRPAAIRAAAQVVIERCQRRAARAARRLKTDPSLEACHALRLDVKKLRYVAEPFESLYGKPLQVYLKSLQRLQTVLGRINDARNALGEIDRHRSSTLAALSSVGKRERDRAMKRLQTQLREDCRQVGAQRYRIAGRRWDALHERLNAGSNARR